MIRYKLIIVGLLLCQIAVGQGFVPDSADTFNLKKLIQQEGYSESIGYRYLRENYKSTSKRDSVQYYEWELSSICSFHQSFEYGIIYSVWKCKEAGGVSETIQFPKMDFETSKNFIELLFYDKWNSWVSENKYEPDGAGCYYELKQTDTSTVIDIYCGC